MPKQPATRPRPAPEAFPLPVRSLSMQLQQWLRQVVTYRESLSVDARLDGILWSWPIRRALTRDPGRPMWTCQGDDDDTLERKGAVVTKLNAIADEWYPVQPPPMITEAAFCRRVRAICDDLEALDEVVRSDATEPTAFLAQLLEDHWGDGHYDYRRAEQRRVMKILDTERDRMRVCRIAEQARDRAFLYVATTQRLDALRHAKLKLASFGKWLRACSDHADFVEAQLGPLARMTQPNEVLDYPWFLFRDDVQAFHNAFQAMLARKTQVQHFLEWLEPKINHPGRERREHIGKPPRRLWVEPADQALKHLNISKEDRRALVQAWGLIPLERDVVAPFLPRS